MTTISWTPSSSVWETCKVVLAGQVLALINSLNGAASTTLEENCEINSPTFQTSLMYVFLSFHLIYLQYQQQKDDREEAILNQPNGHTVETTTSSQGTEFLYILPFTRLRLRAPWYYYLILAVFDLEANYLSFLAFRYTSFTSVTLITAMSVPSAVVFSKLILKRRYHLLSLLGILICMIGFVVSVLSDIKSSKDNVSDGSDGGSNEGQFSSNRILGDFVAMIGAIMYGLNDTLCEKFVKTFSIPEYLGMLGLFGMIIGFIQCLILERDFISILLSSAYCSQSTTVSLYAAITISLLLYYMGASRFLFYNDVALLDVSILTTNLYAVLFVIVVQATIPSIGFFAGMMLVIVGIVIYKLGKTDDVEDGNVSNEEGNNSDPTQELIIT